MDLNENLFCKGGGGGVGGSNSKNGEGFIDRSRVRILLCDNDAKSSLEVFTLLCKCSYQVTSVRSPRQVVDALNAEGPEIDLILSEVDLPMAKGLKMLKYIMRDKELRRIPVIMMSAQDEVSLVVKCLRLGAADYLVKPLRTNELLNLWTHMWRRRRMLGLAEKNILNYEFDLVASDPSDANTNSTMFSDDTDDKSRKSMNLGTCASPWQGDESNAAAAGPSEIQVIDLPDSPSDVPGSNDQQRVQNNFGPKKSELRIGQSSAFFTYVKSSMLRSSIQEISVPIDKVTPLSKIHKDSSLCGRQVDNQGQTPASENVPQHTRMKRMHTWGGQMVSDMQEHEDIQAQKNRSHSDDFKRSNSIPDSFPVQVPSDFPHKKDSGTEELPDTYMHPTSNSQHEISGYSTHSPYPYYISGMMNQVMMSSAASMFQKNLEEVQNHATAMLPQHNHMPHCPPHMPGMASFPYYPINLCLQPGQMPTMQQWPTYGSSSSNNGTMSKVDRREAALLKFRQKRKERCFDKKIRYVNRKKLAERRPRVRGQFVRKVNGINVDLNGQPTSTDLDDDEEEDEEEDYQNSTPDDDLSVLQG